MSDKPIHNDEQIIKELQERIESLKQKEAVEKLTRSQIAKPEERPAAIQPTDQGDQAELKGLVAGKTYDASTQARSILERAAPTTTEQGMNQRVEVGPEYKDKEDWPGRHGPEG